MTREEAHKLNHFTLNSGDYIRDIIDKIYDDFNEVFEKQAKSVNELELRSMEPRICDNCKYCVSFANYCKNPTFLFEPICSDIKYCGKWEAK